MKDKLDIFIHPKYMLGHLYGQDRYNLHFEIEKKQVYDAAVFINTPKTTISLKVKKGNVICLMGEPAYRANLLFGYNLYMYKKLNQYDRVFSVIKNADNVIESQPYLGWFEDKYSYEDWKELRLSKKKKKISCISSDKLTTKGHKERFVFVERLKKESLGIDFYGRGYKELVDKYEGLREYKYSIAIENGSFKNYFSEKIMDCFLNYTVPIYFGCPNIKDFFPEDSYILIDIRDANLSIEQIKNIIHNDDYESRVPALIKARNLVLEKYNLYSFIEDNEDYILSNINNDCKSYDIKPVFSLTQILKDRMFPKVRQVRDIFYRKVYYRNTKNK